MPSRLTDEKCKQIALEYQNNSWNKTLGLLACDYSESYANSGRGHKLYDNARVKAEITKLEAENKAKSDYTREQAELELDLLIIKCEVANDRTVLLGAIKAKNKLYGLETTVVDVRADSGRRPPDAGAVERSRKRLEASEPTQDARKGDNG